MAASGTHQPTQVQYLIQVKIKHGSRCSGVCLFSPTMSLPTMQLLLQLVTSYLLIRLVLGSDPCIRDLEHDLANLAEVWSLVHRSISASLRVPSLSVITALDYWSGPSMGAQ